MSKNRWIGVLAVATALMTGLASQPALAGEGTGRAGKGGPTPTKAVPLSAEQITSSDGTVTVAHYYRDSNGRTRIESGSLVTISDPASKTTVRLDTRSATFQRLDFQPSARDATVRRNNTLTSSARSLGDAEVGGVRAQGREYTLNIPAFSKVAAQTKQVTLWLATDIQLTVSTRIVDDSGSVYEQRYTNIRAGVEPSADLFAIPAGYRVATPSSGPGINASCPVENAPDPLVLNSYDLYWDAGYVTALTDMMAGCSFIADGAAFQYPLWGNPVTPIGLHYDQWVAFDTGGGGLPFLPYVAFGDIAFVAFNGNNDTTTKDSAVVLTVWCC